MNQFNDQVPRPCASDCDVSVDILDDLLLQLLVLDGSWQFVNVCDLVQNLLKSTKQVLILYPGLETSTEADKDSNQIAELVVLSTLACLLQLFNQQTDDL